MAVVKGRTGSINFGTALGNLKLAAFAWSMSLDREIYDSTAFSPTSNARTTTGGLQSCSGSASGFIDDTNLFDESVYNTDAAIATFTLTDGSNTYSVSATVNNFSPGVQFDGLGTWSCTFVGSGPVTIS